MNTPEPCDKCVNLYYDPIQKDDPLYTAECKLKLPLGVMECKKYVYWKETFNK